MPGTSTGGWPIPLDTDALGDTGKAIRDLVDAIEAGWTAYTPVLTATTTNPTIGNGTISGRYKRIGKTVFYSIELTFGGTTVVGSGNYLFSLPPIAARSGIHSPTMGQAELFDTSATAYAFYAIAPQSTSTVALRSASGALVSNAAPFAWATGDKIVISGSYEAA